MRNLREIIDPLHIEDLRNELHPSIFDINELYDLLIIRIPMITDEVNAHSFAFIITHEESYIYDKEKQEFEELENHLLGVYFFINKKIDRLLKSFIKYQEMVSDMEESLYANNTDDNFLNNWLSVKLEVLRIERILVRTADTVSEFIKSHKKHESFPENSYEDIYEHIERTSRSALLQLSKLDYLYSFYNAKSNDKMNKMIYILTIISAIFLPLNLVVGFFGMNTSGLPFAGGVNGTYFAVSLMLTLGVITYIAVQSWRKKIEK